MIGRLITGDTTPAEPLLLMWGILLTDDALRPWDLLIAARNRFESALPVERPFTEPDIALWLPGRYLILIEAKFTSFNMYYERGLRKDAQSLTLDELLDIYHDPSLRILDHDAATQPIPGLLSALAQHGLRGVDGKGRSSGHEGISREPGP